MKLSVIASVLLAIPTMSFGFGGGGSSSEDNTSRDECTARGGYFYEDYWYCSASGSRLIEGTETRLTGFGSSSDESSASRFAISTCEGNGGSCSIDRCYSTPRCDIF